MSYSDIVDMAEDWGLRMRLIACAAQEQPGEPVQFVDDQIWRICAQPGWDAAWASAKVSHAGDGDYEPGKDPGVITDGMILSGVQLVVNVAAERAELAEFAAAQKMAEQAQAEMDRAVEVFARQREVELAGLDELQARRQPDDNPKEVEGL